MKKQLTIFMMSLITAFTIGGCGTSESGSKMSLEDQEKANPAQYLTVQATYDHDVIGESSIDGSITNKATIADFRNVVLKVDFYGKDNAGLGNQTVTVTESVPSGETKLFKASFKSPEGTENVNWTVVSATPY